MRILDFPLTYAQQVLFTLVYYASELPTFSAIVLLLLVHEQSNLLYHTRKRKKVVP